MICHHARILGAALSVSPFIEFRAVAMLVLLTVKNSISWWPLAAQYVDQISWKSVSSGTYFDDTGRLCCKGYRLENTKSILNNADVWSCHRLTSLPCSHTRRI